MTLKGAITFAILMQNNKGILSKAPRYVREKFRLCDRADDEFVHGILDPENQSLFTDYLERWEKHFDASKEMKL